MLLGLFITIVSVWSLKYKNVNGLTYYWAPPLLLCCDVLLTKSPSPLCCAGVSLYLTTASALPLVHVLTPSWSSHDCPPASPRRPARPAQYRPDSANTPHTHTAPHSQYSRQEVFHQYYPTIVGSKAMLFGFIYSLSAFFTFDLDNLPFHIHYSLSNMKWIEMYITFCWPFNSLKYLLIGNIFNKKYLREDNEMHPKERSVFTLANFYECDIGKQLSFFSKLSIADLGPDKYELITETGSHFSKKHHSHHT